MSDECLVFALAQNLIEKFVTRAPLFLQHAALAAAGVHQ